MNGNSNPILIYLAGPIDDVPTEVAQEWREDAKDEAPTGVTFFSPAHAYSNATPATALAIDRANRNMIAVSDGLIANLAGLGRGFGSIREIEFARMQQKPVAVIHSQEDPIVSLLSYDLHLTTNIGDALEMLLLAIKERRDMPRNLMIMMGLQPPEQMDE